MRKEVEVEHIVEAGTLRSFDDLGGFAERLFCETDGLRVSCEQCHKSYHKQERARDGD